MKTAARISASTDEKASEQLRQRLKRCLLKRGSGRRWGLASALREIRDQDWDAYLFGGFPRDLAVFGPEVEPRDIDVVVEGMTSDQIISRFSESVKRRTRFGGVVLEMYGWHIDVWPVEDTWGFKLRDQFENSLDNLPKTTFLNAEAIALQLRNPSKKARKVYEHGFFDGLRKRVLEVNLKENPYPELCIVRALLLAVKLDFSLGPSLVQYIVDYKDIVRGDSLSRVQKSHYGFVKRDAKLLRKWIRSISEHWEQSPREPFDFSSVVGRQISFWDDAERDVRKAYTGYQLSLWQEETSF